MPALDLYTDSPTGLDAPSMDAFAITPTDSTDLSRITRAIYVGGGAERMHVAGVEKQCSDLSSHSWNS